MKKIKVFITIFSIFLILAIYLTNIVYSTSEKYITVTTENLKTAYDSFLSKSDDAHFYADVTNTTINIHSDELTNPLNYTLNNGTTFTINSVITPDMTYEAYSDEISKTILPLYGFLGVAIIQEVNLADAFTYISSDLLSSTISKIPNFSSSMISFNSNSYIQNSIGEVTDNSKPDSFNAFEKTKMYDVPIILSDSDEFSLYTWEIKKVSSSAESITISSTLTVNESDNFIKLDEYNKKYASALNITNNSISLNRTDIVITTSNNTANTAIPNTIPNNVTITELPKAGINITLINIVKVVLVVTIITIIIFTIYNISQKRKQK